MVNENKPEGWALDIEVHPSHELYFFHSERAECNLCGSCTCCDRGMDKPCKEAKEIEMGALKGVEVLKEERIRQIAEEGYSVEGDVGRAQELHRAGTAYLQYALMQMIPGIEMDEFMHPSDVKWLDDEPLWPWARETWKPETALENMIKGGALIAAALDHPEELDV